MDLHRNFDKIASIRRMLNCSSLSLLNVTRSLSTDFDLLPVLGLLKT